MNKKTYPRHLAFFEFGTYLIDVILVAVCYWLAYAVRFEGAIPAREYALFTETVAVFIAGFLLCDVFFGLGKSIWRYVSLRDIEKIGTGVLASSGVSILIGFLLLHVSMVQIPRSIYVLNGIFLFLGASGMRLSYRILDDKLGRFKKKRQNVLIIGDRDIAASLQYSILQDTSHHFNIVGFITTTGAKIGTTINATPIVGALADVARLVHGHDVRYIFIAVDTASNEEMKRIIKMSQQTGAEVRIVPGVTEVLETKFSLRDVREIRFEDYLERKPVEFDINKIKNEFYKKTILVTGGGGSIGSGLCKELYKLKPGRLLVLDISEDNLFRLSCELKDIHAQYGLAQSECRYVLADVKDMRACERVFSSCPVDYVIHAAARKHVPFCETNILEAIQTNLQGTANMIKLAHAHGVRKFVYISTDKAVEPTSVMGATKRVGELLIKSANASGGGTVFSAVRFGNVIGSSGNVIEVFTRQLAKNQPLTITDPGMERYFMSLNEAVRLILQATAMGAGGEVFVLDMGAPVKIKDLAADIALFYGRNLVEKDIVYIGKRDGEKLAEALLSAEERKASTSFSKIFLVEETAPRGNAAARIEEFLRSANSYEPLEARGVLFSLLKEV